MKKKPFLFLILVVPFSATAQWLSVGSVDSVIQRNNEAELWCGRAVVRISTIAEGVVRVRASRNGSFDPDLSVAMVKKERLPVRSEIHDVDDRVTLSSNLVTVVIRKSPLRISFYDSAGVLLNEDEPFNGMGWNNDEVCVWKVMPRDEQYFGLGEKSGSLNRTGKSFTMWNSDIPAYRADTDPLYQTIPFYYGIRDGRTYGIFFDNSYWSFFDFGKQSPARMSFGANGGEINYYFFAGRSPKEIISRFTDLVGRMPLPPKWSLGYQQCRWSYSPESRVRQLAKTFRDKKIPCDMIYLDIDYMEGYRIFTFSQKNFPDPKQMISDLAGMGFKIAVIVDPGIKADSSYHAFQSGAKEDVFLKYPDGKTFIGKVWPGECAFPDFSSGKARRWWGENLHVLTDAGVRGFWNDMNEPSVFDVPTKTVDLDVLHENDGWKTSHARNHNTYGLQMTQATYEGARKLRQEERPFVLTRASYAGGQRYSAAWTGDNVSSWEHLQLAVPMCLGVSISGQPFVGADIGGFIGSPTGELFARWLQLGVFTPLMRSHTVINSPDQEPWSYGEKFEEINRRTIELRYRLLPYIYSVMAEASATGVPAMRPLVFEYPDDPEYVGNGTEFMFGDNVLVAPVLWEGDTVRELRLPAGEWYDYWTSKKFDGQTFVKTSAPVDRIPFFVKAGTALPTQQVVQYADQAPVDPLMLSVFPGPGITSSYYEDDGHSFDYEHGGYFKRTMNVEATKESVTLSVSSAQGSYNPPARSLVVRFVDTPSRPSELRVNGTPVSSWQYDSAARTVTVSVQDERFGMSFKVVR